MTLRNIIRIDQNRCNGCGLCVAACAEGAIRIINGKARLVSETYCDGLGACLGCCPQGAIAIEKREAAEFSESPARRHLQQAGQTAGIEPDACAGACPGTAARMLPPARPAHSDSHAATTSSQLAHWPIQLALVSPDAPYFRDADVVLAADCAAFAVADFHNALLKGRSLAIACPKLDDTCGYVDKLAAILKNCRSLKVVHMEVPCCFGLVRLARAALAQSGRPIDFEAIKIRLDGSIESLETAESPRT